MRFVFIKFTCAAGFGWAIIKGVTRPTIRAYTGWEDDTTHEVNERKK